jgi:ubiquinone/menaquinone biosynthesis C-methylase UbiE
MNPLKDDAIALEIGGRRGGLSLYLAHELSLPTICSDLYNPAEKALDLHAKFDVNNLIKYDEQNCLNLSYSDCSFDVIIFKSVIGALGSPGAQQRAISEIYRCLKPGGVLLFAENAKSTWFHNLLRKTVNEWSANYWYYPSLNEMKSYLSKFSKVEINSNGLIAVFFKNSYLKMIAEKLDIFLVSISPAKFHYVVFGIAVK